MFHLFPLTGKQLRIHGPTYASSISFGALWLPLDDGGGGLVTFRAVIVIEVGGCGCGTGDGDGDFFERSTGCASAMSTCSSIRRGEGADVEWGDWKYLCCCWSMGGEDTGRPLGVGVLRWLPIVVVVMTLAELANGELARSLAAKGQPLA